MKQKGGEGGGVLYNDPEYRKVCDHSMLEGYEMAWFGLWHRNGLLIS
jgi:hypothetical protein